MNQRAPVEGCAKSCVLFSVLENVLQSSVRFSPSGVRSVCVEYLDNLTKIPACNISIDKVGKSCVLTYPPYQLRYCN